MMKKFKIKRIVMSAVLFGIFAAISAGLFFSAIRPGDIYDDMINNGGIVFSETTAETHSDELFENAGNINKIIINLHVSAVRDSDTSFKVTASEDENVHLSVNGTYYSVGKKNELLVSLEKDGKDLVAEVESYTNFFSVFPFNFINFFTGEIMVKIPASYTGEIVLDISAGALSIDVQNTFSAFELEMSAGTINIPQITTVGAAKMELSAGTLKCDILTADSLDIKISAGTINLGDIETANETKINLSAGTLKCDKIVTGSLNMYVSAGEVIFSSAQVSGKIYAKLSAGDITIKTVSLASEVELRMSAGTINFSHPEEVEYKLEYKISAGRLNAYNGKFTSDGYYNHNADYPEIKITISAGTCNIIKSSS